MTQQKIDTAILDCYQSLYLHATPSANFQELMDTATINRYGQKEIKFNDYTIPEELCTRIINNTIKKYRMRGYLRQQFKVTILLGCSPRFSTPEPDLKLSIPITIPMLIS